MALEPSLNDESAVARWTRRLKIAAHQTRRIAAWRTHPESFPAPERTERKLPHLRYSTRISLSNRHATEPLFEAGKKHNVALAAPAFHGLLLAPDRPFSFWRTLGRVTQAGGYRFGMELSGGCIVPAIGGGLCLLARALFQAAVFADMKILERHGHSMIAVEPPAGVPWGIDATIYWPYVDLRFAPTDGRARLSVKVKQDALLVSVTADTPLRHRVEVASLDEREAQESDGRIRHNRVVRRRVAEAGRVTSEDLIAVNRSRVLDEVRQRRSCLSCGETECASRVKVPA